MSDYIEIQDLEFSYDKMPILQNVNAKIKKGEFIGIFGPNGGGKTTFLKLLMGFLKPKKGTITVFGNPPKNARSDVGYVPQAMHFDKQFPISVLDVLLMGCMRKASWLGTFSSEIKEKARETLKLVGLADKQNHAFGSLSGGQAQRVLIARALVNDPKLLLLDEPTANIDSQAEQEIYEILTQLKGQMTILMVTHDLKGIIERVDQSLCIHRVLTSYLPKDLCEHFALGLYHPPIIQQPFGKK